MSAASASPELFTLYPGRLMHRLVFGVPDVFATPERSNVGWLIGPGADLVTMVAALAVTGFAVVLLAAVLRARSRSRGGSAA